VRKIRIWSSFHSQQHVDKDDVLLTTTSQHSLIPFIQLNTILKSQGVNEKKANTLIDSLVQAGFESMQDLITFGVDFQDRPETLSTILKTDFNFNSLDAHKLRAALMEAISLSKKETTSLKPTSPLDIFVADITPSVLVKSKTLPSLSSTPKQSTKFLKFKEFTVVSASKINKKSATDLAVGADIDYGLKDHELSEELAADLNRFLHFMTTPSPRNQEPPIRKATSAVYINHAKLYLGWFTKVYSKATTPFGSGTKLTSINSDRNNTKLQCPTSLNVLFPSKTRDGAELAYQFIQFLRDDRKISVSYEANVLRGITKLAKYVFHEQSSSDPYYGTGKSFDDIPCIAELRKLHRQANKRQASTPRSSDEKKKWLTWTELMAVIQSLKMDYEQELVTLFKQYINITAFASTGSGSGSGSGSTNPVDYQSSTNELMSECVDFSFNEISDESTSSSELLRNNPQFFEQLSSPTKRRLALKLQRYLILAIFGSVPDRQRTIRELRIGSTFVKEEDTSSRYGAMPMSSIETDRDASPPTSTTSTLRWTIKHGPDDYKTGKSYGDRPPLILPTDLTPAIDDFIAIWRPVLRPSEGGTHLFIQPRTGHPFTQDSTYQSVARACYEKTGKKTNPHLIRDIVVTHVRETDASEKELEALALYMGHSIKMQRTSYDRRTLNQKVAPAVNLLHNLSLRK